MSITSQNAAQTPITPFVGVAGPTVQDALAQISADATGGTVTTVSVTTANGVSGSVATPTTTPAVTLTLGAITPSSIVCSTNATALAAYATPPRISVAGADGVTSGYSADAFGITPNVTMRRANGTNASKSAIPTGAAFFSLLGIGYGASAYSGNAAAFTFNASEPWTDSAWGCQARISTTPIGSTTRVNSLVISDTAVAALGAVTGSNLAGTNTGDQLTFKTIAVAGQSDIVADSTTDTLTLANGANIELTTDATTDTLTVALALATAANNGQVVTYGPAVGPGGAAVSVKEWATVTVGGNARFIPLFGV